MHTYRHRKAINMYDIPLGVLAAQKLSSLCCPRLQLRKDIIFKGSIIILTYLAYAAYHMSRKPISVVKSVLHENCTNPSNTSDNDCGYPPFDVPDASTLFGTLDSAFLVTYAISMFVSGIVAERVSLRYYLSLGMLFSGLFTLLFGAAKSWNIHSMWYFVIVQVLGGIVQTTGWPGVVTLMARWFGRSKRGLIFGIWNSHTSVGNILGTLIAAHFVESNWMLSFAVPGAIMSGLGFVMFLFIVDDPEIVGLASTRPHLPVHHSSGHEDEERGSGVANYDANIGIHGYEDDYTEINHRASERTPMLTRSRSQTNTRSERNAVGLLQALAIPGVVEFSLCLFFAKLVSYTFLYWLPLYIQSSTTLSPSVAADVSTLFDIGGIFGAIAAGTVSDYTGMPATTCLVLLVCAAPLMFLYVHFGGISLVVNYILLLLAGFMVNGPYALITTFVSAELGQHQSLSHNAKALATVTAIIDGTGSIGAAVGPFIAGLVSQSGWENVFNMLICADILAMIIVSRQVVKELIRGRGVRRTRIE
ncbi:glucose-6-phosphate exchanger SLC37A2 isoform X1 [Anastrepha obliqua]|uniref:glucose-6-phosphate exchanger SLC37A2 isoform X1 n=1 Tax=Anastrepha obliqua TaxID=95512 RepID=UPI002409A801|nr:glucose-6-phosphate exchanger SLC37A2 isoform X1 [Anastrepha obliqua]XP_054738729.1 glucose-6-phosphate exchanger SLC37A2 isoform X1 [Anastrepha obliqua]